MNVLSNKYPGFVCVCDGCGALLSYTSKDMYEKKYVYCILCKHKIEVPEIKDAIIVNGETKEE